MCSYNLRACGVKIPLGLAGLSAYLSTFSSRERSYPNEKEKSDECLLLRRRLKLSAGLHEHIYAYACTDMHEHPHTERERNLSQELLQSTLY